MSTVPIQFSTTSSIMDRVASVMVGPMLAQPSVDALRERVVELHPTPENLVSALLDYHADLICQPAREALSDYGYGCVRTVVGRLVRGGQFDQARRYVALQIEVVSVAGEATRHMHEGPCGLCPDLWQHCDALEALESREERLHQQIAAIGGW